MTNLCSLPKSNFKVEYTMYKIIQEQFDRDLCGGLRRKWRRGDSIGALLRYLDITTVDFEASWDLEAMEICRYEIQIRILRFF